MPSRVAKLMLPVEASPPGERGYFPKSRSAQNNLTESETPDAKSNLRTGRNFSRPQLSNGDIIWLRFAPPHRARVEVRAATHTLNGAGPETARWHVKSIDLLLMVWGVVTAALVIVVIYRGTLSLHEDDQLFLGESESHLAKEQQELVARLTKLTPIVRLLGVASGALILVIAGIWIWHGLNAM